MGGAPRGWVATALVLGVGLLVVTALTRRARSGGGGGTGDDTAATLAALRPTMYGASWCGFTRRQLAELSPEELACVDVVDCGAGGGRCEGVRALPTWEVAGGRRLGGYVPRNELGAALQRLTG